MQFEWDPAKGEKNIVKHGVSFEEATTVFADRSSQTIHDPDHSESEDRFVTLGISAKGRLLIVCHVDRKENIRIISSRKATRREAIQYSQQ